MHSFSVRSLMQGSIRQLLLSKTRQSVEQPSKAAKARVVWQDTAKPGQSRAVIRTGRENQGRAALWTGRETKVGQPSGQAAKTKVGHPSGQAGKTKVGQPSGQAGKTKAGQKLVTETDYNGVQ